MQETKLVIVWERFFKWELDSTLSLLTLFKRQTHKMVKHTQTIRRQQPANCLSVSDHFVGLAFKELKFPCTT